LGTVLNLSNARCAATAIVDHENPMDMVGHDHKLIHLDVWKAAPQAVPFSMNNPTDRAQPHLFSFNFTQKAFPLPGDNGDKVHPCLGIIVPRQANGTVMVAGPRLLGRSGLGMGHNLFLVGEQRNENGS
jgi:hypothetical protein